MDIKNLIPFGKKSSEVKGNEDNPFVMMQREMNRIFDTFTCDWGENAFPEVYSSFTPRMDVSEDSMAFTVTAELPGMDDKDIDVSITRDTLNIKGGKEGSQRGKRQELLLFRTILWFLQPVNSPAP